MRPLDGEFSAERRSATLVLVTRVAAMALAVFATSCSGKSGADSDGTASSTPFVPVGARKPPNGRVQPGEVVVLEGRAPLALAVDRHHLAWVSSAIEEEAAEPPSVLEQDMRTGRKKTLARGVFAPYGIASTSRWVVYASGETQTRLLAVRHGGSRPVRLASWLVAPVAARGELVAWAQRVGSREEVVVRDMTSGRNWLAASLPRCVDNACYRIDAVTLADRGIVFTRAAIGSRPSLIVRRAFSAREPETREIPNDPQPDLAPSSAGALYYRFQQGWFRWDFGSREPTRLKAAGPAPATLLRLEGERLYRLEQKGCSTTFVSEPGGPSAPPIVPHAGAHEHPGGETCLQLNAIAPLGRQIVAAWTIVPEESEEEHSDEGVGGVVSASMPSS